MTYFLYEIGGKMDVYIHHGYARIIRSVDVYYEASRDALTPDVRRQLFPADRPVRTKIHEHVSTYYGEHAASRNSLVGDNCIIEGEIEDCIIFSGCKVGPGAKLRGCILMRNCEVEDCVIFSGCHIGAGAKLKGCIVMRNCTVEEDARLEYVIADKAARFSENSVLIGSPKLPTVVPKDEHI